ncbi:MAG: UbiA family prenyltransferase [Verrucomicrobiota bacterium]|nr:UbiA family prenyltransferase [Verrucomicrobiota bacterium]MCC6819290.1 UbiA family prenyltransferase [Limisphaerales bacterium]
MPPPNATPSSTPVPLAVDLDGTLIRTDMLWESLGRLLCRHPFVALRVPFWLRRGRAYCKQQLVARVTVDPATLPYHKAFLDWLKEQKAGGRILILATASDINMATPIANHIGLFDDVMASDGKTNLRNAAKHRALTERFGEHGYDYAGNSTDDLGVWPGARAAVVVNAPESLARRAAKTTKVAQTFLRPTSHLKSLASALRPLQWIKNLILFIPVLTAHQLGDQPALLRVTLAFVAFCLADSAAGLLNALRHLDADRQLPTQRHSPLASGDLPLQFALLGIPLLLLVALGLALGLSCQFAIVTGLFFATAISYSGRLEHITLLEGLFVAGRYAIRLVAGLIAAGIP